jgi:hypothetical protein
LGRINTIFYWVIYGKYMETKVIYWKYMGNMVIYGKIYGTYSDLWEIYGTYGDLGGTCRKNMVIYGKNIRK